MEMFKYHFFALILNCETMSHCSRNQNQINSLEIEKNEEILEHF